MVLIQNTEKEVHGEGCNYYLKMIYGDEFDEKCGSIHKLGVDDYTITEHADYTAYQVQQKIDVWKYIFGDYGSLIGGGNFDVDTVIAEGYTFPHYKQYEYERKFGPSTIHETGCIPTSLAMIVAGLNGDSNITPISVVENLEEYYSNWQSYHTGSGGTWTIVENNDFLKKYYNCKSTKVVSDEQAYSALEAGKCLIGYQEVPHYGYLGHALAVIPVPDEYKESGQKFYILDSGFDSTGPYISRADAATKMYGFKFEWIIEPCV